MKILHTADIHVGYTTHGKPDPATGLSSRLMDFKRCFQYMVSYAIEQEIDLFLFCGDAYQDAKPSPTEQQIFTDCLKPLIKAGVPIVMLVGNHDHPFSFGKANSLQVFADLAPNVHLFDRIGAKDIQTKSGKIRVVGLPWPVRSNLFAKEEYAKCSPEELRSKIHEIYVNFIDDQAETLKEEPLAYPTILAAHLHLDTARITEGSERVTLLTKDPLFAISTLIKPAFSYVALGHIHKHQDLNQGAEPPVVYSGSIERISFSEWEQKKGFVIVDIDEEKRATYTHVPTPARPFVSVELDVKSREQPTEAVKSAIRSHKIENAVVRVRIECSEEQKKQIDEQEIKEALDQAFSVADISFIVERGNRSRDPGLSKTMSAQEALERYLDQKKYAAIKNKVLQAAVELENENERNRTL